LQIGKLAVKSIAIQNTAATVRLDAGILQVTATGSVFGGSVKGDWRGDFTGTEPGYTGSGTFDKVALAQVASAMHDNWATGTADASYRIVTSGWTSAQLLDAAAGSLDFTWRDGTLRRFALGPVHAARLSDVPAGTLRIRDFRGHATLRHRMLSLDASRMETPGAIYTVSGTASSTRELALTFTLNRSQQYTVAGTLDAPRVEAVAIPPARASVAR
jgi:hypothetical protein